MSFKKRSKHFYNTPLNLSKTIDLPSNLLSQKCNLQEYSTQTNHESPCEVSSPRQFLQPLVPKKQEESTVFIEEQNKNKKNVLYKRLADIKTKNDQLNKYSYSKLLSKMVVMDQRVQQSVDMDRAYRTISQYSCLRGKLVSMDYDQKTSNEKSTHKVKQMKASSGLGDYANKTTKIFKRLYMPSSEKASQEFNNKQFSLQQKYIYINGKKTQCKRIHNFYTSEHFRNSYDRAFGKTQNSFYARHSRQSRY